ncbi:hypothetical protein KGV55_03540 [Candidatus Gracilibacteria bacterium]|nr:hypothetical protein [Candidatus Gracilibacteria bacterium]
MHEIFKNHQIIAVDCDEVLSETIAFGLKNASGKVPKLFSSIQEISDFYFVNMSDEIERSDVVEFFFSTFEKDRENLDMPRVDGALEILKILKKAGKELYIITARHSSLKEYTQKYIQKHFPNIFTEIYFADHFTENHRKKSEICKEIGATLLIDDSIENALDCAENDIQAILLKKPWNKNHSETHKNILKIDNWKDLK